MCMGYINVGTDTLKREYMSAIIDTGRLKPAGGLWCTEFTTPDYIPWMDYMLEEPSVFFRKAPLENPFKQKAVAVDLKGGAKIFHLKGNEMYHLFKDKYAGSYEALSESFDGVFIDVMNMFGDTRDEVWDNYRLFGVSTLILFNLDIINSYRKIKIDIEPFEDDYYYSSSFPQYRVELGEKEYRIEGINPEYATLLEDLYKRLRDFVYIEKKKYPKVSSDEIAYMIYKQITGKYLSEVEEVTKRDNLNPLLVSNSLATNLVRKVK